MGLLSAIGSAFSSACSYVGSAVSSAVGYLGRGLGTVIEKGMEIGRNVLGGIAKMAGDLLWKEKVFEPDETVEKMGDRAIQAHEQQIFPEKYENFNEYMQNLRDFNLDPKKSEDSTPDQKIIKGLEVGGRALDEKFGTTPGAMANVWMLGGANPEYFTSDRFQSIFDAGMDITAIANYFEGKLGVGEALKIEDRLVDIDRSNYPEKDERTTREEVYKAAETVQKIIIN
jgi:hypothetical protein